MPELPDIAVYIEALGARIIDQPVRGVRLSNHFLLRTATPPIAEVVGRSVRRIRRIGKRIAICLEGDLWLVLHLMIAGRLHWQPPNAAIPPKRGLAALDFPAGALILTEAGSKRRASLHLVAGADRLAALDPGGIEPLEQYPSRLNRTGSIGLDKIALIYQWLEQLYPISRDR